MAIEITVRALDANGDPLQGNGQNNFISGLAAATQIISTHLKLFRNEWFLNLLDGLPMIQVPQAILGSSGAARNITITTNLIAARISELSFVVGIPSISASYQNRSFIFSGTVETIYGTVFVSSSPGSLN